MNGLIFTPNRNVHSNDYEGAFKPEAQAFRRFHDLPTSSVHEIDVSLPAAEQCERVLAAIVNLNREPCSIVAFFCHGWPTGLQLGIRNANVKRFAAALRGLPLPADGHGELRVVLYACSTGAGGGEALAGAPGGDDGIADRLRDALCVAGLSSCRVDAHASRGHATRNPYVRRFAGDGSPTGGHGGQWLVAPHSPQWRTWRAALSTTDLRFRFPFMTSAEIHGELVRADRAEV